MVGVYEDFPETYHSVARFSHRMPTGELQRVLIQSLYLLNQSGRGVDLLEFAQDKILVSLELGIAEGLTFNYIDRETLVDYQKRLRDQWLPTLDFLCVVRYYVVERTKQVPLRFDYYMLRFLFSDVEMEMRVFHEKGTRRLSTEDLVNLLIARINQGVAKKKLGPLKLIYMHAP